MLRFLLLWHDLEAANAGVKPVAARASEGRRNAMVGRRITLAGISAILAATCFVFAPSPAGALHACDAVDEEGWRVTATVEVAEVKNGAPYRAGSDWVLDRTTTTLPFCNYITPTGGYSLRSYSLDPVRTTERVVICRGTSPVAPYAGPCPPRAP